MRVAIGLTIAFFSYLVTVAVCLSGNKRARTVA
jgi:hypothetical protein